MLINASRLIGCPVLSLHIGGRMATVTEVIVDPNQLQIIACRVEGPLVNNGEVGDLLPMQSVREFSPLGMIVDSADVLAEEDDIVQLKKILDLHFSLPGLKVETKKGTKLGKVSDYVVESTIWQIQQLIVHRPVMKSLIDPELIISRSEIREVNDYKVIVKDEESKIREKAKADFVPSFVNPFREPDFAAETNAKPRG